MSHIDTAPTSVRQDISCSVSAGAGPTSSRIRWAIRSSYATPLAAQASRCSVRPRMRSRFAPGRGLGRPHGPAPGRSDADSGRPARSLLSSESVQRPRLPALKIDSSTGACSTSSTARPGGLRSRATLCGTYEGFSTTSSQRRSQIPHNTAILSTCALSPPTSSNASSNLKVTR